MEIEAQRRVTSSERRGEDDAVAPMSFEEFFLEEHDRLYRALFFITGSSHEADDLAQEAFAKLGSVGTVWIASMIPPPTYPGRAQRLPNAGARAKAATRRLMPPSRKTPGPVRGDRAPRGCPPHARVAPHAPTSGARAHRDIGYNSAQAGEILGIRASTVRALASQGRAALRAV